MIVRCHFCSEQVDTSSSGVFQRCTGWISTTKTGKMLMSTPATAYAHAICIEVQQKGTQNTASLF